MHFSERRVGEAVAVDLVGRLTLDPESVRLRKIIRDLLDRGETRILLNLSQVSYVDSAGVGELVASYTLAETRGAELKLLNLTTKTGDLLQITQLSTVFETYDDEAEAVSSFD